ncbi:MAG: hypothetical protein PHX30_03330 [Candidatus Pacebacteria bacterium]|nr:hypothetical protein [Candidatus Paceibacterota bacterium]
MEHLYLNGYVKKDKLGLALHHAKIKGNLHGVEDSEIGVFINAFEEVISERHREFLDRIDHHEMQEIITIISRDHTDIVDERELQTIASVLLDKEYKF